MTTDENDALQRFMRAIPKAELHCHLLGSVRRATFEELARRAAARARAEGQPPPLAEAEVEAFYTRGDKPVGVLRVLRALDRWLLTERDDFARITYEYLCDAAAHGVRYSEFFWNPTGTAQVSGLPYPRVLEAIRRGIADAQRDAGITGRLVPSIDREASPQAALEMVRWAAEHRCDEVPGIGIDYQEAVGPPHLFVDAYEAARRAGLRTTAHAGEFGLPAEHVRCAIEDLRVDRVDHGYTIVQDEALARRARDAGIVFTVVPTNSYYLRTLPPERWAQDHPIRRMHALGLRLHPNTDDPTLHHVNPTGAWTMMHSAFGLSVPDLRDCLIHGLDTAWIDDATRRAWRTRWLSEFDALHDRWRAQAIPPNPSP